MKKRQKKSQGRGGHRPGSGRKPAGEGPVKSRGVSCTDSQWERWREAAASAGKNSLSEWVREILDTAADAELK